MSLIETKDLEMLKDLRKLRNLLHERKRYLLKCHETKAKVCNTEEWLHLPCMLDIDFKGKCKNCLLKNKDFRVLSLALIVFL